MNNNKIILLDTHIILWLLLEPGNISNEVQKQIIDSQRNGSLHICSISLWEIAMLATKKRIHIYMPIEDFLSKITNTQGLCVNEISSKVAAQSVMLSDNFHGDPADRIIVATTKIIGATIVTKDKQILEWAKKGNVKFLYP